MGAILATWKIFLRTVVGDRPLFYINLFFQAFSHGYIDRAEPLQPTAAG
jgi:hypothetical protein